MSSASADRRDHNLVLFEQIVKYQRKRRIIGVSMGHGAADSSDLLSLGEYAVLSVLDAKPDKNVKDLAEMNNVERSWMSRIVSGLESRALIRSAVPENDRRAKTLRVTTKGREALEKADDQARQVMDASLESISQSERREFEKLLSDFASGLGAINYPLRDGTDPAFFHLGRISRASGGLGENFMNTGFNVTQLQVLQVLNERESSEIMMSRIQNSLPFDFSTISRVVAEFVRQGLISKKVSSQDKRVFFLSLTADGQKRVTTAHAAAEKVVRDGTKDFSAQKLDRFIEIFEKVTAVMPLQAPARLHTELNIREIVDAELAEQQSKFVARHSGSAVKNDPRKSYGLFHGSELRAVIKVSRDTDDDSINSLLLVGDSLRRKDLLAFFSTVFELE